MLGSKSEKVYTRLYLNKLESIMRALSDALPTGHRGMANPTLQLHFGCGRATPPVSHSHNCPSGRMQNFLFKIGQKSYFFANKDPKTNFDDWMILQKHALSFKCNDFLKMANLKAISSSATLSMMYRALWDRRHEGALRISQCTRRVAPSALTYPSGPWVPPISQCTIHHA